MREFVLLDSGPLGLACRRPGSPLPDHCRQWFRGLILRGVGVVIPEIADYEVRRELMERKGPSTFWHPGKVGGPFRPYVTQKVESGMYHSVSEVIRDGLRLMKERDELHQSKLAELRKELAIGAEQADGGQVQPFNEETTARVKARGRSRLNAQNDSEQA